MNSQFKSWEFYFHFWKHPRNWSLGFQIDRHGVVVNILLIYICAWWSLPF